MDKHKLSPKQDAFCREYTRDLNATQAAIRAGYAENGASVTGTRLLANPRLASRIAELQVKRIERTELSADKTIADILLLVDMALGRTAQPKTVIVDGEPHVVMVRNVSMSGAARALELLCRHQGLLNDKLAVNHAGLDGLLESLAEVATSTPAGRIKARVEKQVH